MDSSGYNHGYDEKRHPTLTTTLAPPVYSDTHHIQYNSGQAPGNNTYPPNPHYPMQAQSGGYATHPTMMYGQYPTVVQPGPVTVETGQQTPVIITSAPKPNTYLALSILTCLCCVWPVGLVAIIFSCLVDSAYGEGNLEKARTFSKVALILGLISLILGIIIIVICLPVYFARG